MAISIFRRLGCKGLLGLTSILAIGCGDNQNTTAPVANACPGTTVTTTTTTTTTTTPISSALTGETADRSVPSGTDGCAAAPAASQPSSRQSQAQATQKMEKDPSNDGAGGESGDSPVGVVECSEAQVEISGVCVDISIAQAKDSDTCHQIGGYFYSGACHGSAISCPVLQIADAGGETCNQVTGQAECVASAGFWYDASDVSAATSGDFAALSPSCHATRADACPVSGMLAVARKSDNSLASLNVTSNHLDLSYLTVQEVYSTLRCFSAASSLRLEGNSDLIALDLTSMPGLTYLTVYYTNLASVDLSRNPSLTHFDCENCDLNSVDFSHNPQIDFLWLSGNPLISLNLSGLTHLNVLYGAITSLTAIDLSDQKDSLSVLDLAGTQITSLDLSDFSALEDLRIDWSLLDPAAMGLAGKQIQSLSMASMNLAALPFQLPTSLVQLNLSYNNLTSLNLSNMSHLQDVRVWNNMLTSLNVANCSSLEYLNASSNQLASISLSTNTSLTSLSLEGNALTSIDLGANINIEYLGLADNQLSYNGVTTFLDLSSLSALTSISLGGNPNYVLKFDSASNQPLFHANFLGGNTFWYNIYIEEAKWASNSDASKPSWYQYGSGNWAYYSPISP